MSRVIHEGQYEMWDSLQLDILEKFIGIVHVETKKKKKHPVFYKSNYKIIYGFHTKGHFPLIHQSMLNNMIW